MAARLSSALCRLHKCVITQSWHALTRAVSEDGADACLVDADHPSREAAAERVRLLRRAHPSLTIVVCADFSGRLDYFDFGGLGADGILQASDDLKPAAIRAVVDGALAESRATRIAEALEGRYDPYGPRAVAWAFKNARLGATVEAFAAGLGLEPNTIHAAFRASGLPAPGLVLVWGRLLRAGAYVGSDGYTVEAAALHLGYADASSLGRAMKRHTGLTPSQVAERGGLSAVQGKLFPRMRTPRRKRRGMRAMGLVGLAFVQSACASLGGAGGESARRAIDEVLDRPPVDQVHFGVLAVDAASGKTLYARDPHRKFVPASNQKLLVTSTALSILGPDFRYSTEVWATGSALGSMLDGDLVVVASGDPSFSDRFWTSGTEALQALADSVAATGLRHVAGSVFVDVSAWDSTTVGPTWEVEDLRFGYGSTGGAFAIDEGEVRVVARAGAAVGTPAEAEWFPVGTDDFVISRLTTAPPDSSTRVQPHYLPESRRLVLEGRVRLGHTDTLSFAMRDPVRQASAVFAKALAAAGVEVEHGSIVTWEAGARVGRGCLSGAVRECPNAGRVAAIQSPPLSDLMAGILKPSQNWMTEQLVRTLGAERGAQGSWREGIGVIEAFLVDEVGIDSLDIAPRDGSGLSAYNLVTPRALVRILQFMRAGPYASAYRAAMAEPGEEDSTLERRLTDLEGRLFAKTGTISNVNSLSGYLVQEDGREVIFSILSNGSGLASAPVRAAMDDVVRILARQ